MTPPCKTAKEVFLEAVELTDPAERERFLDQHCRDDARLRAEVRTLLRNHEREGDFLEALPLAVLADDSRVDPPGTRIGCFTLLEKIGEGGMGVVYRAEQTEPVSRRVALKVIKPGMDSSQVVARFEAERQTLAMMDHPNIAKILDAGATDSGRRYFVMELVHGVPITRYCDQHSLSIENRLELFVLVCRAAQHAHQKGIIHRDLKPSNILITIVDGVPVPKIIDFGIAKATSPILPEQTQVTGFAQIIGTPRYMSPEQAASSAGDIDTRSDIYSLGVLLYELLTGTTPVDASKPNQEVLRLIREEEPPRPSTRLSTLGDSLVDVSAHRGVDPKQLARSVRGELDWIVMKALEKERDHRYASANDFANDLMRYLTDQPVEACPPSVWYRFRKSVRRNRGAWVTAALIGLMLLISTVVSAQFAIQARGKSLQSQREALLQEIVRIVSIVPAAGWSSAVERKVAEASQLLPDEHNRLQSHAAASLRGLDAHAVKWMPIAASELAFDSTGSRLYLCDTAGQSWVYDEASASPERKIGALGACRFAFRTDGTVLQLLLPTPTKPDELELRTFDTSRVLKGLDSPRTLRRFVSPLGPGSRIEHATITRDGSHVAATIRNETNAGFAVVWNTGQDVPVRRMEIDRPSAIALTPDARWVAVGTEDGEVMVWPLPNGEPLPRFTLGRMKICSLAFAPDRLRRARPSRQDAPWLLAVGDVATRLGVHELATHATRGTFRGSNYEVVATAFNPDAMLLASASREEMMLWDLATQRPALRFTRHDYNSALAFSPDGTRLAVSGRDGQYPEGPSVTVYQLENGRGFQTLWGLDAQIDKLAFSKDKRLVAALAQDFRVGIWDRVQTKLLHVLEVPLGVYTDNAGLAFSLDGKRFAYACGARAVVWSVETGEVLSSWALPEGFQDNLAYDDRDRLISTRVETTAPTVKPYGGTDREKYPRVLRIRELQGDAGPAHTNMWIP